MSRQTHASLGPLAVAGLAIGLIGFAVLAFGAAPLAAQPADSAWRRPAILSKHDALVWGGGVVAAALLDVSVRDFSQDNRSTASNDAASVGNSLGTAYVAAPALAATWLVGAAIGKKSVRDAALWAAASGAVAGGITVVAKTLFGRVRPPAGDAASFHPFSKNTSFPSGHTSFAFAIASSLAHSTKDGWSDLAFYGLASFTGWSRINNDRHWTSDVVAGAALGYLVGRQLRVGRKQLVPVLAAGGVGVGLSF